MHKYLIALEERTALELERCGGHLRLRIVVRDHDREVIADDGSSAQVCTLEQCDFLIRCRSRYIVLNKPAVAECIVVFVYTLRGYEETGVQHRDYIYVALAQVSFDDVLITRQFGRAVSAD